MGMFNELIKELRETANCYYGEICSHVETIEKAADTIELLQKKLEENKIGGWIPCSERLPEESGFYMVTKKIKETGNRFTGKSRFDTQKGWNDPLNFVDIVAWQPLPEVYHG